MFDRLLGVALGLTMAVLVVLVLMTFVELSLGWAGLL